MENFVQTYHKILCPDYPQWLNEYIALPSLQRLSGVGLLCGTDYTALYKNRFYYSRLDHSIGTALITWNFTHDKIQTLASLFHDVATAAFSHVNDFRKGDALRQEITEDKTAEIIKNERQLLTLLKRDGIEPSQICDYHIYPVCDNEIPCLSADRLEYMFPSNMSLAPLIKGKIWTLDEVRQMYSDISLLRNENGVNELGFNSVKMAELYTEGFIDCGLLLQTHENKIVLNMLGKIVNMAIEQNVLNEDDCFNRTENQIITLLDEYALKNCDRLSSMIKTWRQMQKVEHFQNNPGEGWYSIQLNVKQRYINPLVKTGPDTAERVSNLSSFASKKIEDFLKFKDTPFGAVRLV